MRKLFPFALAGLAALSFSVFAADSSVKSNTSATGSTNTAPSSAVDSRHDNPNAGAGGASEADKTSANGDASSGADKPMKKKHKAKKASKDKASSGSSASAKKHRAGSASSGSSMPENKTNAATGSTSGTTSDKPGAVSSTEDSRKQK